MHERLFAHRHAGILTPPKRLGFETSTRTRNTPNYAETTRPVAMASPKEERPVAALLVPDILALLDDSPGDVAAETEELHPANLADVAEALPRDRLAELMRALPAERAADVLEYLDEELRSELLEELTAGHAAELVSQMTPDDRADALEDLEEERADEILSAIGGDARGETERLLAYETDSAGGLMTTEVVAVPEANSVDSALESVRAAARAGRKEAMYAIYALDAAGALRGLPSIRQLPAAPPGSRASAPAWPRRVRVAPAGHRAVRARP